MARFERDLSVRRRRRPVPFWLLFLLAPMFRYSTWRDAWILRVVGEERGPVLVRHTGRSRPESLGGPLGRDLPLPALAAAVATVVALGFFVARGLGSGTSPTERITYPPSRLFQVAVPAGWHAQTTATHTSPALTNVLVLRPAEASRSVLILGRIAAIEPAVARRILGAAADMSAPKTVMLGGARFEQYSVRAAGADVRASESLYMLPSRIGMIVALCRPGDVRPGEFAGSCERVLSSVKISRRALRPSVPSSYATALAAILATLNATRAAAGSRLAGARNARDQAVEANSLAEAHSIAASELARVDAGAAANVNAAVVAALGMTSRAYQTLARAAARDDPRAFARARVLVERSGAALNSAFLQLDAFGYHVG